jgi:hypothetical protein
MSSKFAVQVEIQSKLGPVCDKGSGRYALGSVQVTPADNGRVYLAACNGRAMALVGANGTSDKERLIPNEALPSKPGKVTLNGRWESVSGKKTTVVGDPVSEGRYPRLVDVVTELGDRKQIRLNIKYLLAIAEAINDAGGQHPHELDLFISEPDKSVMLVGDLGVGVLMPVTHDAAMRDKYDVYASAFKAARAALKSE